MRERILTCEQAASVRAAYRNSRDRICKVHALLSEGVNIRGAHFLIAHISMVHRAPLIGKEVENVRPRAGGVAGCLIGSGNSSGGAGEEMTTIHWSSPEDPPRAQPCKEDRRQRANALVRSTRLRMRCQPD